MVQSKGKNHIIGGSLESAKYEATQARGRRRKKGIEYRKLYETMHTIIRETIEIFRGIQRLNKNRELNSNFMRAAKYCLQQYTTTFECTRHSIRLMLCLFFRM